MKLLFGVVPYLFFAALLGTGIVKASQPDGSYWLLIVAVVLFLVLMFKSCLPVKH